MPSRRVPPVERLERIARERDRPSKDSEQRRRRADEQTQGYEGERDEGEGHIDIRV
jgi:hypothetical protein